MHSDWSDPTTRRFAPPAPGIRLAAWIGLVLTAGVLISGCTVPPSSPDPAGPGPDATAGPGQDPSASAPLVPIAFSHGNDPKFTLSLLRAVGYSGGCGHGDVAFQGGACHLLTLRLQHEESGIHVVDINAVQSNGALVDWVCVAGHCGVSGLGGGPLEGTFVFNTAGSEPLIKVREEETGAVVEIPPYAIGTYASGVRLAVNAVVANRGVNCYGNPTPDYDCHNITVELENKGGGPVNATQYNSWEILTGATSYGPPFGGAPTQGPAQVAPGSKAPFSLLANLEDAENVAKVRFYDGAWMLQPAVASRT